MPRKVAVGSPAELCVCYRSRRKKRWTRWRHRWSPPLLTTVQSCGRSLRQLERYDRRDAGISRRSSPLVGNKYANQKG